MQIRAKRQKKPVIPTHFIIADLGEAASMVMTSSEIEIFNAYFHFSDTDEVSKAVRHNPWFVNHCLRLAFRKIIYLYSLPSIPRFVAGQLTKQQFLDAPILLHRFSTRLYHAMLQAEVFNLREIIAIGRKELKQHRGFGDKGLQEITDMLQKKGCGHLFI